VAATSQKTIDVQSKLNNAVEKYDFSDEQVNFVLPGSLWQEDDLTLFQLTSNHTYQAGNLATGYTVTQFKNTPENKTTKQTFVTDYYYREQMLEKSTRGTGSANFLSATTKSFYDANGNRTYIEESVDKKAKNYNPSHPYQTRYMRYDAEGKLMSNVAGKQKLTLEAAKNKTDEPPVDNGEPNFDDLDYRTSLATKAEFVAHSDATYHLYSGSNYLGELSKDGNLSIKEQHFKAPTAKDATIIARHTVQSGETLQSIAKLYYGDADLWYVIASQNGLNAGSELTDAQMLDIPARQNAANTADSFKPMNLSQVIGDTTPALPYIPPPPEAGCNAVASIVMIVVAVVVTVYTGGLASSALVNAGWGATAAGAAGGAVGAAAGSVASQGVGIAAGWQDEFSWKQVGLAAAGGAITGGISGANGVTGAGESVSFADYNSSFMTNYNAIGTTGTGTVTLSAAGRAVSAVASTATSAAVSKLMYGKSNFSWANVAASAAMAAMGGRLPGEATSTGLDFADEFIMGIGRSAVGYGVNRAFGGDQSWNFGQVAVDAFGNAIGNSIVQGIASQQQYRTNMAKFQEAVGDSFARINEQGAQRSLNQTFAAIDQSNNALLASQVFGSTYQGKDYNQQNRQSTLDNYYADSVRYYNGTVDAINQGISAGNKVRETLAMQVAMTKRRYQIGDNYARMDRAAYEYAFNRGIAGGIVDMNDEITRRMWAMNQKDDFAESLKTAASITTLLLPGGAIVGGGLKAAMSWGAKGLNGLTRSVSGAYNGIGRSISAYGWKQSAANVLYRANPMMAPVHSIGNFATRTGVVRNNFSFAPTTLEAGLNKSAATLAKTAFGKGVILHGANGLVSGSANLGVDYLFNGSNKDFSHYAKTFVSGFVGGVVGSAATFGVANLAAKRGASTLAATLSGEMIGGAVGGFVGKGIDNYIKDNSHDLAGYAYSMSVSSMAGTGVAIYNPKWGKYTQFGFTSVAPGSLENLSNNLSTNIQDWWNR